MNSTTSNRILAALRSVTVTLAVAEAVALCGPPPRNRPGSIPDRRQ
jgi:hypothetical protein